MSSESTILRVFGQVAKREGADCELHPLIYTLPTTNLTQDVKKKKGGAKDSAFSWFKPRCCS